MQSVGYLCQVVCIDSHKGAMHLLDVARKMGASRGHVIEVLFALQDVGVLLSRQQDKIYEVMSLPLLLTWLSYLQKNLFEALASICQLLIKVFDHV